LALCWVLSACGPASLWAQRQVIVSAQQAAAGWMGAGSIQQQNGAIFQSPTGRPVSRRSGLSLKVDTRWANNYGYRPVQVTINSPKAAAADRLITIKLHTAWFSNQRGSIAVEQDLELLTGSTTATATISCPQYQLANQYFWWDVWVDGVKDRDLSVDDQTSMRTMIGGWAGGSPQGLTFLAVGQMQERLLTSPNTDQFAILWLPAANFPKQWIDYTCLDVVTLSLADLQLLAQSNPEALTAIERWVRAGGQLWVSDAGKQWEQLPEISKLFKLPAAQVALDDPPAEDDAEKPGGDATVGKEVPPKAAAALDEKPVEVGWRPVRFNRRGQMDRAVTFLNLQTNNTVVARDPDTIAQYENDPNFTTTDQEAEPEVEGPRRRGPRDSSRWFVQQPLGMGYVRAFGDDLDTILAPPVMPAPVNEDQAMGADPVQGMAPDDPAAVAEPDWPRRRITSQGMALRSALRWDARHGMTPADANMDFADLLVPGVGLAPVTEFRVLITLFVLLIGPVNYFVLKRLKRLHLLVLTVPLAAALMTGTLFAYAVLSDGFGTSVRVHSVTRLDQRTGESVCWARLSYYAGLAPGQGLAMPTDVAIYPIIPGWNDSSINASVGAEREILWEPPDAKLVQGWLRSRTPTQYLTIRARKSPHRLELAAAKGKLTAANGLGTTILYVVAADEEGRLFAGENLPAESSTSLQPVARADAIRRVRQLLTDNKPEPPAALAAEESDLLLMERRNTQRMMRSRYGLSYSDERLSANLMNDELANLAGLDGGPALQLPPRSYVAFTETGPEVVTGIPRAREEASFHVVIGQW
jgi:hypothetical protein